MSFVRFLRHKETFKTCGARVAKKGNKNWLGKTHSDEAKQKMSEARKGCLRAEGSGRPSQKVEVFDLTKDIKTTYDSISDAARALGVRKSGISSHARFVNIYRSSHARFVWVALTGHALKTIYLNKTMYLNRNTDNPFKGRYILKKIHNL